MDGILNRRGLTLAHDVRSQLRRVGIVALPSVSLEYQHSADRYVVRGIESGGAVTELGRYVTFCNPAGEPLPYLCPIDAIAFNGVHAVVVAPVLVRVELFRSGRTCQLLVTRHEPSRAENRRRPSVQANVLFRGINGFIDSSTTAGAYELRPRFWTRSGEDLPLPSQWIAAVLGAVRGASCMGCCHPHFVAVPAGHECD